MVAAQFFGWLRRPLREAAGLRPLSTHSRVPMDATRRHPWQSDQAVCSMALRMVAVVAPIARFRMADAVRYSCWRRRLHREVIGVRPSSTTSRDLMEMVPIPLAALLWHRPAWYTEQLNTVVATTAVSFAYTTAPKIAVRSSNWLRPLLREASG